jgi:transcriptional regulator with XRE-family HTH domain
MAVHQKIINARKKKGLTQEQLAEMTNITVRTIQRIESGESNPRPYTLQSIATALDLNFEALTPADAPTPQPVNVAAFTGAPGDIEAARHFLQILCLSCFTYLVIPFVHFLVPGYILKKSGPHDPATLARAGSIIKKQLYWVCVLHFLMLVALAYNLIQAKYFGGAYMLSYLLPFFGMYFINAVIIVSDLIGVKKQSFFHEFNESKGQIAAIAS